MRSARIWPFSTAATSHRHIGAGPEECCERLASIMHDGAPATQNRPSSNARARWCILEESDDFLQRLCWVSGAPDGEASGGRQSDRDGEGDRLERGGCRGDGGRASAG